MSDSVQPHGLQPSGLLCPWDSPGKNTEVGCFAFLQGIVQTQGWNSYLFCLLHWQVGSLSLAPPGKHRVNHIMSPCPTYPHSLPLNTGKSHIGPLSDPTPHSVSLEFEFWKGSQFINVKLNQDTCRRQKPQINRVLRQPWESLDQV